MVFGFFSRKSTAHVAGLTEDLSLASGSAIAPPEKVNDHITETGQTIDFPDAETTTKGLLGQQQLHTQLPRDSPQPLMAAATPPPPTPSPPPRELVKDPRALYDLIASVPAQTLHSYCLERLDPSKHPSANISPKARKRKSTAPSTPLPPTAGSTATAILSRKHGHRKSLSSSATPPSPQLELNLVSPEDLTALTTFLSSLARPPKLHSLVSAPRRPEKATYETLWGCCGRTVEGDGDQGPPDGWCFEGMHTVDARRARWRADSTPQDTKLVSCSRNACFKDRQDGALSDGSSDGTPVRSRRKRAPVNLKESDNEEEEEAKSKSSREMLPPPPFSAKRRRKTTLLNEVTPDSEKPASKKKRKSRGPISPEEVISGDEADEAMEVDPTPPSPRKRGRPPKNTTTPPPSSSRKPKSKLATEAPYTPTPASTALRKRGSVASMREVPTDSESMPAPPTTTKRKVGRPRKSLGEVVDSSVPGEIDMA